MARAMRILFVTSNRLGDAVLSTGLLDHLLRTRPGCRITVVCGRVAEGLFAHMPGRERTIVLEKRPWSLHWLPLWAKVVPQWWDLVVDIRSSGLAWLVPTARRAVMRQRPGHKTAQLAAILGLPQAPLPVVWPSAEDRALAAATMPAERPVVALAPTANWPPKMWPVERFAALFRALAAGPLPNAVPVIFAGPGPEEARVAAALQAALPGAIDLTARLSLTEIAACLERAALFVGNDSGLMHLAAAAGAPTLGLFGPTPAEEYAPAGRRTAAVLSASARMEDLSVESALAASIRLLAPG
jgi:ADP-heptose:LPS heptosyltransferase